MAAHWDVAAVAAVALVPLTWFRSELIAGGDEFWLLNPGGFWPDFGHAWTVKLANGGGPNFSIPQLWPIVLLWHGLEALGLEPPTIERIWAVAMFGGPGFAMLYLGRTLAWGRAAGFAAAVLYMCNLFLVQVGPLQPNTKPVMIAIPLMLGLLARGLQTGRWRYGILVGAASLLYAQSNVNPSTVVIVPMVLGLYGLGHLLVQRTRWRRTLAVSGVAMLFTLVLNAWWLLPMAAHLTMEGSAIQARSGLWLASGGPNFSELFRFLHSWAWTSGHLGVPYFPFAVAYAGFFLTLVTFLLALVAFAAPVLRPRDDRVLFFTLLGLVGLFLAKGTGRPFGGVYPWLFAHVPGFWIFREPFPKFMPLVVLSMAVLVGFSMDEWRRHAVRWRWRPPVRSALRVAAPMLVASLAVVASFPLVTGDAIWDRWNGTQRTMHVAVPEYWTETGAWFERVAPHERVLLLPKAGYGAPYAWDHGFNGGPPAQVLLPNPILSHDFLGDSPADRLMNAAYASLGPPNGSAPPPRLAPLLALLDSPYVVHQRDLDWVWMYADTYPPEVVSDAIARQPGLSLAFQRGELDVYELDASQRWGHVYATNSVSTVQNHTMLVESVTGGPPTPALAYLVQDQMEAGLGDAISQAVTGGGSPELTVTRLSQTQYRAVGTAEGTAFVLVLAESYHPGWNARVEGGRVLAHFTVNGFANGWLVDAPAEFRLELFYAVQGLLVGGAVLAGLGGVAATSCFLFPVVRRRWGSPDARRDRHGAGRLKGEDGHA